MGSVMATVPEINAEQPVDILRIGIGWMDERAREIFRPQGTPQAKLMWRGIVRPGNRMSEDCSLPRATGHRGMPTSW